MSAGRSPNVSASSLMSVGKVRSGFRAMGAVYARARAHAFDGESRAARGVVMSIACGDRAHVPLSRAKSTRRSICIALPNSGNDTMLRLPRGYRRHEHELSNAGGSPDD